MLNSQNTQHASGQKAALHPEDPAFFRVVREKSFPDWSHGHWIGHTLSGRTPPPNAIQMHTNDYLCLAADPRIVEAEIEALRQFGHGQSVSRIFLHRHESPLRTFERRIAQFMAAEDAVLCMSGYSANSGLIQAIAPEGTPVYLDMRAHASLWEGVPNSGAVARPFRHNDPFHLERQVGKYGPGIIVVDALYSTTGNICPLADVVAVAERTGCILVVDETHSFGTLGPNGEGLAVSLGLADRIHFRTVGMSKAVASRGGVVLGSARNMEFFRYEAFPMIFSTTVLPHEVAGYDAALDIIQTEAWRRERLHANHRILTGALDEMGYNVSDSKAQIIGLEAGTEADVIRLRDALETRGVFGAVFCAPATPKKRAMVRFTVNCGLSDADLERVIQVCRDIRDEVGMWDWAATRRKAASAKPKPRHLYAAE